MRIVVKIGSSVLLNGGKIDKIRLENIVNQIAILEKTDDVIVVSSGAIAAGTAVLNVERQSGNITRQQALSAVGQPYLVSYYQKLFDKKGIKIAQVLLSRDDLANRRRYLNAKNTLLNLIKMKVVPVINENDTVVVYELCFGDNDNLSSLVASLIEADLLIILSDVEGIYDDDPKVNPNAKIIRNINNIEKLNIKATNHTSFYGTGGMKSKIDAIRRASSSGIKSVVANGKKNGIILDIMSGKGCGTTVMPDRTPLQAKKYWLLYDGVSAGSVHIDQGAYDAIKSGKSLLPAGVKKAEGAFQRGDIVDIIIDAGTVGKGIINYSYSEAIKILGKNSARIFEILGYSYGEELIRRENMAFL